MWYTMIFQNCNKYIAAVFAVIASRGNLNVVITYGFTIQCLKKGTVAWFLYYKNNYASCMISQECSWN